MHSDFFSSYRFLKIINVLPLVKPLHVHVCEMHTCSTANCFCWVACSEFENLRCMCFLNVFWAQQYRRSASLSLICLSILPSALHSWCMRSWRECDLWAGIIILFLSNLFFLGHGTDNSFSLIFLPVPSLLVWFLPGAASAPCLTYSEQSFEVWKGCFLSLSKKPLHVF